MRIVQFSYVIDLIVFKFKLQKPNMKFEIIITKFAVYKHVYYLCITKFNFEKCNVLWI
jgi:hypothetical protein